MRVLYVLANYPQASESYVDAEIGFMTRSGVDVRVWSPTEGYGDPPGVFVYRGELAAAVQSFCPQLIHVHYLVTAFNSVVNRVNPGIPVTVRAHSFDWHPARAKELLAFPQVKAIYAFPHFAAGFKDPRVVPLPVAYDETRYDGAPHEKVKGRVVRLAAGRRMKGLEDFIAVAHLLPDMDFQLAVARVKGDEHYVGELAGRALEARNLTLHADANLGLAAYLTKSAEFYLDTSDPRGHAFGMPISIAEAMSSGAAVLARRIPSVEGYIKTGAMLYDDATSAARLIKSTMPFDLDCLRKHSLDVSKLYRSDVVLPRVLEDWRRFTS